MLVRNSVPWDERIVIDNEYINKFNIFLDLKRNFFTLIEKSNTGWIILSCKIGIVFTLTAIIFNYFFVKKNDSAFYVVV